MGPANVTPRLGLSQSQVNQSLVFKCQDILSDIIHQKTPGFRTRTDGRYPGQVYRSAKITTAYHSSLLPLLEAFGGAGVTKKVPKLSFLLQHLTEESFAFMLMMDGNKKGPGARSMELHLTNFSRHGIERVCVAIYQKFGIMCWPASAGRKNQKGEATYQITISGESLPIIHEKILPYFLEDFKYKVPEIGSRPFGLNRAACPWDKWYEEAKNAPWLETVD
jgi:hypothetical protein